MSLAEHFTITAQIFPEMYFEIARHTCLCLLRTTCRHARDGIPRTTCSKFFYPAMLFLQECWGCSESSNCWICNPPECEIDQHYISRKCTCGDCPNGAYCIRRSRARITRELNDIDTTDIPILFSLKNDKSCCIEFVDVGVTGCIKIIRGKICPKVFMFEHAFEFSWAGELLTLEEIREFCTTGERKLITFPLREFSNWAELTPEEQSDCIRINSFLGSLARMVCASEQVEMLRDTYGPEFLQRLGDYTASAPSINYKSSSRYLYAKYNRAIAYRYSQLYRLLRKVARIQKHPRARSVKLFVCLEDECNTSDEPEYSR